MLGELDTYFIGEGTHTRLYEKMGAHVTTLDGVQGTAFTVWAPNAQRVSVVGDFNGWDGRQHSMRKHLNCGVWEIFLPEVGAGTRYKYEIVGRGRRRAAAEGRPVRLLCRDSAGDGLGRVDLGDYAWTDQDWMEKRADGVDRQSPISVYEVHLGSWKQVIDGETGESGP